MTDPKPPESGELPPDGDAEFFADVAGWYGRRWKDHPIEAAYYALGTAQRQALVRHILVCLGGDWIHPDDLADWIESYHQGRNRHLLEDMPVTKTGLRLAERKRDSSAG